MLICLQELEQITIHLQRKKEKCERSQLRSMDWCGERPFGHRAAHHLLVTNSFS